MVMFSVQGYSACTSGFIKILCLKIYIYTCKMFIRVQSKQSKINSSSFPEFILKFKIFIFSYFPELNLKFNFFIIGERDD